MVANVLMDNDNYEAMLDKVSAKKPDILFFVETNQNWADALDSLKAVYPYRHLLPLEDYNGMLFYSKFPILNVQERYLVQDHIPSLTIDLDVGAPEPLHFYGVHPRPPRVEDDTADLDKELLFVANEAGHLGAPRYWQNLHCWNNPSCLNKSGFKTSAHQLGPAVFGGLGG